MGSSIKSGHQEMMCISNVYFSEDYSTGVSETQQTVKPVGPGLGSGRLSFCFPLSFPRLFPLTVLFLHCPPHPWCLARISKGGGWTAEKSPL